MPEEVTPHSTSEHHPPFSWFRLLNSQWFLISILVLIPCGVVTGPFLKENHYSRIVLDILNPQIMTFLVLFLMSWTLETSRFRKALSMPAPVIYSLLLGYVLIPLLGKVSSYIPIHPELHLGIFIACCVPTTLATASVYTRKAGGNDAISLVTTLISNLLCPFVTPYLLLFLAGKLTTLNQFDLLKNLLLIALLPTILGQVFRYPQFLCQISDKYKMFWSILAQCGVLWTIFRSTVNESTMLRENISLQLFYGLLVTWVICFSIHGIALYAAHFFGLKCNCPREKSIPVMFVGSQKTLPVGVYIASTFGESAGLIVLPIIIFHVNQLIFDSWIINLIKIEPPITQLD